MDTFHGNVNELLFLDQFD